MKKTIITLRLLTVAAAVASAMAFTVTRKEKPHGKNPYKDLACEPAPLAEDWWQCKPVDDGIKCEVLFKVPNNPYGGSVRETAFNEGCLKILRRP
jgi:hypothetical protein